jgi:hypothetical protein
MVINDAGPDLLLVEAAGFLQEGLALGRLATTSLKPFNAQLPASCAYRLDPLGFLTQGVLLLGHHFPLLVLGEIAFGQSANALRAGALVNLPFLPANGHLHGLSPAHTLHGRFLLRLHGGTFLHTTHRHLVDLQRDLLVTALLEEITSINQTKTFLLESQ